MNGRKLLPVLAAVLLGAGMLGLTGCATVKAHLPWRHQAPPPPEVSTALTVTTPEGAAVSWPQFWQRNAVILDLAGITASGSVIIAPRAGLDWPVRVALRVTPGAIGTLDVRGAQRWVVPVPTAGSSVDLELPPGIYRAATRQITVSWGPAAAAPAP